MFVHLYAKLPIVKLLGVTMQSPSMPVRKNNVLSCVLVDPGWELGRLVWHDSMASRQTWWHAFISNIAELVFPCWLYGLVMHIFVDACFMGDERSSLQWCGMDGSQHVGHQWRDMCNRSGRTSTKGRDPCGQ